MNRKPIPASRYPLLLSSAFSFGLHMLGGLFSRGFYTQGRTAVPFSQLPPPPARVMIALAFGQSNAANYGSSLARGGERVYNFYDGTLYQAEDPLLGADGPGGSVWSRLGAKLIAGALYDAVVFVPIAVGGSGMDQWTPGGVYHRKILDAIDRLNEQQHSFTHLLWHQGETDAMYQTPPQEYRRMFLAMLANIRDHGVQAPIYVSVATRVGDYVDAELQRAQAALVDAPRGIMAGPDTDVLVGSCRYDGTHLSEEGLERAAELWLAALRDNSIV